MDDEEDDFYSPELRGAWQRAVEAIEAGDDKALQQVLIDCPDIVRDFSINEQLLSTAARLGHVEMTAALLNAGIPADVVDELGGTALMDAAWNGHLEVARLLLQAGADPNAAIEEDGSYGDPSASGRCALFCALAQGHTELVELLEPLTAPVMRRLASEAVELKRQWDAEDAPRYSEATTRLFMAAQEGRIDRVREAIAAGADVNALLEPEASNRILGSTPLSFAAAKGLTEMVQVLLSAGANPGLKNHNDFTAADFATFNGHTEIARLLREAPPSHPSP